MTQLLLDLEPPLRPTFDNFIVGRNGEALSTLRRLATGSSGHPSQRCVYLWGDAASGRSHLALAACDVLGGCLLSGRSTTAAEIRAAVDDAVARRSPMLAVDAVDAMDADAQEALFHAINALRDTPHGALVVTGNAAPRDLLLHSDRDDLRSRLAWGLVYRLHRLDDAEKDAALAHRAHDQGFPLPPDVRRYLLTHFPRDLGVLMRMVAALDRHARETRRVVTVPLIRAFLQRPIESSDDAAPDAAADAASEISVDAAVGQRIA